MVPRPAAHTGPHAGPTTHPVPVRRTSQAGSNKPVYVWRREVINYLPSYPKAQ